MRFNLRHIFLLVLCVSVSLAGWVAGRNSAETVEIVHVTPLPQDYPLCEVAPGDVAFVAETFQADLKRLIGDAQYSTALWLLMQASPDDLIKHNGMEYFATGTGRDTWLPATEAEFDETRDFVLPRGDVSPISLSWPIFFSLFARRYNQRVDEIYKDRRGVILAFVTWGRHGA